MRGTQSGSNHGTDQPHMPGPSCTLCKHPQPSPGHISFFLPDPLAGRKKEITEKGSKTKRGRQREIERKTQWERVRARARRRKGQ